MSIIGEYARFTPAELEQARRDPDWAKQFVEELIEAELSNGSGVAAARCHDIDKTWHALDFVLQRHGFPVDIVYGEEEIPTAADWGYGPPRFLAPERVRVAAAALTDTPWEALSNGVTSAELAQADIYTASAEADVLLDAATSHYRELVPFFQAAAHDGDAMIIWFD